MTTVAGMRKSEGASPRRGALGTEKVTTVVETQREQPGKVTTVTGMHTFRRLFLEVDGLMCVRVVEFLARRAPRLDEACLAICIPITVGIFLVASCLKSHLVEARRSQAPRRDEALAASEKYRQS